MFTKLIEKALNEEIQRDLALKILEESRFPQNALQLFQTSSRLRDEKMGKSIDFSAGIAGVLPCKIVPRCRYCIYFSNELFPVDSLLKCVKVIEDLGLKQLHLSGGTNIDGYNSEILTMVKAIRSISDISIEINLGPSLSIETVRVLKELDVISVTSSLETINPEIFSTAKPGDSLEKRQQLLEICEEEGVPIRTMMMLGLGESYEDRIEHLFYLQQFKQLYHLRFSRFYPYSRSQYRNHPRCSPWELARTLAVARLIMPQVNLGLAAGNNLDDIPLWYLAGGGQQVLGVTVSTKPVETVAGESVIEVNDRISVINRMPLIRNYIEGMGITLI